MASTHTRIKKTGLRVTFTRMAILELLENAQKEHWTAQEVHGGLFSAGHGTSMSRIYDGLATLADAGLLQANYVGDAAIIYELANTGPHFHLSCTVCHAIFNVHDAWLTRRVAALAEQRGFVHVKTTLTLFGQCHACQNNGGHVGESHNAAALNPQG